MPIQLHYIQLYRLCYPLRRLCRNVRPTSQRRAVSRAALSSAAPTAADDDDFLDVSHDDAFFASALSFSNITTMMALCVIYRSADSIMTSPLLCDTADLSVSRVESLCDLIFPVVQSQAVEGHDTWQHAVLDADRAALDRHDAAKTKGYKQFWTFRGAVRRDAHRRRIYV